MEVVVGSLAGMSGNVKKSSVSCGFIKKVRFIVVSNNSYFKTGVALAVRDFNVTEKAEETRSVELYSLDSASSILNTIEKNSFIAMVIDGEIIDAYALYICHAYKNIILVSSKELTMNRLKGILNLKPNACRDKFKPPCHVLMTTLSLREKRLCRYLYHGYRPKLIGMLLGISEKTVSSHKKNIMRKIGCSCKMDFNKAIVMYNRYFCGESDVLA